MKKNYKSIIFLLFALLLTIPIFTKVNAETPFTFSNTLKYGINSSDVLELQKFLNLNGFLISPTGPGSLGNETTFFGPLTKKAVILFQRAQGLLGDGIVGPMTRGKLHSTKPPVSNSSNEKPISPVVTPPQVPIVSSGWTLPKKIDISAISGVVVPVGGAVPVSVLEDTSRYTATISWNGNPTYFTGDTAYTAIITITPKRGHTLNGISENFFTVAGAITTNARNSGVVTALFPATPLIQLTIENPNLTTTKTYDGDDTAEVTAGDLIGIAGTDDVTVTAVATYDNSSVGIGKTITVEYTLSGDDADKYIKPVNYTTSSGVINAIVINNPTIAGVTASVTGANPVSSLADGTGYTATISWSGNPSIFITETAYTATITLTPKTGYTLSGVTQDFFTVAGASANNSANSGVVSALFPATQAIVDSYGLKYNVILGADGRIWLDRNLGATRVATSFDDYLAFGSLFQWGRGADGHELLNHTSATNVTAVNGSTFTLSTTDTPGNNLYIKNENTLDWRNPKNDNLWQGLNGINNPCPNGFRLPTGGVSGEWKTLADAAGIVNSTTAYNSTLKLTLAGYRGWGGAFDQGTYGIYWSSSPSGTSALDLYFTSSGGSPVDSSARVTGFSVRCIKD